MRNTRRLSAIASMAALTAVLSACGSEAPAPTGPAPATSTSAAPSAGSGDGVTTASDTFGPACSALPQGNAPGSLDAMGPMPVASAASTNPLLTTLVSAVKQAGLVDTLNQQKAITVFAPSNDAFAAVKAAVGEQEFNALLADKNALGGVLKGHVVAQREDKDMLTQAGTVDTLAGNALQMKESGDTLTVTDASGQTATVLCGNIPTSNATVFMIDKVLMGKSTS